MTEVPEQRRRRLPGRMIDAVVGSVVPPMVDTVDLDEVLARVDVDAVLARVDVDALLARVDVDGLLDRVDPDRLLDRVDPDRLLDRVDPDRLLDRVDPDRLLDRVDPDRLLERVDLARLVERAEIGEVVARSTAGVATQLLDVARTQALVADQVVHGVVARVRHRPPVPGRPAAPDDRPVLAGRRPAEVAVVLQGHHAGAVSRFLAFLLDQAVAGLLFALGFLLVGSASEVVLGRSLQPSDHRVLVAVAFAAWELVYHVVPLAASGRTLGKTVLGLRVVRRGGEPVGARTALVRTLAFPLSFLLFGAGFLLGLVRPDRRQLHDLLARTAVILDWDARLAVLRAPS